MVDTVLGITLMVAVVLSLVISFTFFVISLFVMVDEHNYKARIKNKRKAKKLYEQTAFKNAQAKDYIFKMLDRVDDNDYPIRIILKEILNILD